MADKAGTQSSCACTLPYSRVKTIMKSSPDVNSVSQDALYMITKATELFVEDLALTTLRQEPEKREVSYKALAELVNEDEDMQFLQDIIPRKIRAGDWLAKNRPRMKVTQVTKVQNEVINLDTDSNSGQSIIDLTDD